MSTQNLFAAIWLFVSFVCFLSDALTAQLICSAIAIGHASTGSILDAIRESRHE